MGHPISIAVRGLKCINEQESSDEPYVITCLVDLTNKINFAGNTFFHYPVVDSRKLTITRTASVDGPPSEPPFWIDASSVRGSRSIPSCT
jgi:hypothetical protein